MNKACMIELKKEYTILLCNVLTPHILEGLQHLYKVSKDKSSKNNVLRAFQLLLKEIPSWKTEIIKQEVERINEKTKEYPWLIKLIQSIFKLNILINDLEPSEEMKKSIDMSLFIHTIYIECARQFWMDPFLFYHDYCSLEQKKNYCEIMKIIGCSIENSIRRLLPLNAIFEKFLGKQVVNGKSLELTEVYNIKLILDIPIEKENIPSSGGGNNEIININDMIGGSNNIPNNIPNNMMMMNHNMPNNIMMMPNNMPNNVPNNMPNNNMLMTHHNNIPNQQYNGIMTNDINDKIMNILNKNNVLSDTNDNNHFTVHNHSANDNQMKNNIDNNINNNQIKQNIKNHHSDRKSSSTLKRIIHESIKQSHNTATKTNSNGSNMNSDIKNKVLKDLDSETLTYNPEANAENYQDIFSNSEIKHTINTNEKVEKKSREKFFNNYLNI